MRRSTARTIISSLGAATLLLGTAATATAQSTAWKDKRADVFYSYSIGDDVDTYLNYQDSIASGLDATSTLVKHSKKTVTVKVRFAKLTTEPVSIYSSIRVKGSSRPYSYSVQSNKSPNSIKVYNHRNRQQCVAKLTTVTGSGGSLTYTFPRSCIKNPASIKMQTSVAYSIPYLEDGVETGDWATWADSLSPSKVRGISSTKWLKSSYVCPLYS